jgi:hypothetical protein
MEFRSRSKGRIKWKDLTYAAFALWVCLHDSSGREEILLSRNFLRPSQVRYVKLFSEEYPRERVLETRTKSALSQQQEKPSAAPLLLH